ncbi:LAFA_0F10374g1_1 [Lachancea sp. 'fantastica']|nr:LAFA_0F10374g1_1 [Lachancea sp. 'fantastica']
MLRQVTGLFKAQSQESLIKQYTQDLARITSQIHELDKRLKQKDAGKSLWHKRFYLHGSGILALLNAVLYAQLNDKHFVIASLIMSVVIIIALKSGVDRWYDFSRQRTMRKVERLRAQHQEKLETLKQKTHFYSTNSLIKRFSSGQQEEEDAVTLMDEEMKTKYEELSKLKRELADFQKQGNPHESEAQRDKWFDKVLDVISGGEMKTDSQLKPVVCQKCKKHAGSYTVPGAALQYVCPLCNWRYDSKEQGPLMASEKKKEPESVVSSAQNQKDSNDLSSKPRLIPK